MTSLKNTSFESLPDTQPLIITDNKRSPQFGLFIEEWTANNDAITIKGWVFGESTFELMFGKKKAKPTFQYFDRADVMREHQLKANTKARGFSLVAKISGDAKEVSFEWVLQHGDSSSRYSFAIKAANEKVQVLNSKSLSTLKCAAYIDSIQKEGISGWVGFNDFLGRTVKCELWVNGAVAAVALAAVQRQDVIESTNASVALSFRVPLAKIDEQLLQGLKQNLDKSLVEIKFAKIKFGLQLDAEQKTKLLQMAEMSSLQFKIYERGEIELREGSKKRIDTEPKLAQEPVTKVVTFYLPQFHRVAENDEWWGKGFTEWTNVSQARPAFQGHHQPQIPADLGFYDASFADTLLNQISMAQKYGVYGFCFHHYWFNGKRILSKPLETFVATNHHFKFMICWANENWTRRWDGLEGEVLLNQTHEYSNDVRFIEDVFPYLEDPRYITRADGSKWLVVYRPSLMTNSTEVFDAWREFAQKRGVRLHISAVDGFDQIAKMDMGVDSMIQFPPLNFHQGATINNRVKLNAGFESVNVYDYSELKTAAIANYAKNLLSLRPGAYVPGIIPGWDNSARKKQNASIVYGNTPEEFYSWAKTLCKLQLSQKALADHFLFVNAWNEWAEGAHLEPDTFSGHKYISALSKAVIDAEMPSEDSAQESASLAIVKDLLRTGSISATMNSFDISHFSISAPSIIHRTPSAKRTLANQLKANAEQINGKPSADQIHYCFKRQGLSVSGWFALPLPFQHKHPVFFCLQGEKEVRYWSISSVTLQRADVEKAFSNNETKYHALGYKLNAVLGEQIVPGRYELDAYLVVDDAVEKRSSLFDVHIASIEIL